MERKPTSQLTHFRKHGTKRTFVEIVLGTIITRFGFNGAYIGGSEARKQNFSHKNLCE
jgi:hypothetical protein